MADFVFSNVFEKKQTTLNSQKCRVNYLTVLLCVVCCAVVFCCSVVLVVVVLHVVVVVGVGWVGIGVGWLVGCLG